MSRIIIGTAGHVDHGKTTLIKNLTGIDTDRLEEEKKRGLTIDLGFAFLTPDISIIDVPGHEKFIKNMVAGAATINFVMLVIAADDGIMIQTHEHLNIIKKLGVSEGIIILTKTDLIDQVLLETRQNEIQDFVKDTFLQDQPVFCVSSKQPSSFILLKDYLINLANKPFKTSDASVFRLPIDRVFSIKGSGNVITGTVISGKYSLSSKKLMLYPEKIPVTIRYMETQNTPVAEISSNQRCALNIKCDAKVNLYRGQFLAEENHFTPTRLITCSLQKLKHISNLKYGSQVRFHINTGEYIATLRVIGENTITDCQTHIVQFQFDEEISVGFKDKFIIRRLSPMTTIGGGEVLDVNPSKLKKSNIAIIPKYLTLLEMDFKNNIYNLLLLYSYLTREKLFLKVSQNITFLQFHIDELIESNKIILIGNYFVSDINMQKHIKSVFKVITTLQKDKKLNSIKKSVIIQCIKLDPDFSNKILDYMAKIGELRIKEDWIIIEQSLSLSFIDQKHLKEILGKINANDYQLMNFTQLQALSALSKDDFQNCFDQLKSLKKIVILDNSFIITTKLLKQAEHKIIKYLEKHTQAKVSDLKQLLNTSRRYVFPILKNLDNNLLERHGDFRRLK